MRKKYENVMRRDSRGRWLPHERNKNNKEEIEFLLDLLTLCRKRERQFQDLFYKVESTACELLENTNK